MYTFCHVNSYARKVSVKAKTDDGWSVQDILDEATRKEGCFSKEITNPRPPILVYGDPIEKIHETIEDWASNTKDSKKRKTRIDAKCMLAGVFSAEPGTSPEDWEKIKADGISWAKNKYGERLRTVLEHIDEPNPHCHFYVVPLPGEVFETIHEGLAAKKAAIASGMTKKEANTPYVDAMKTFLDEYHDQVGAPNGMTRIGPGRRRLTRKEWHEEKQQAAAIAAQRKKADELKAESEKTMLSAIDFKEKTIVEVEDIKLKTISEAEIEAQKLKEKSIGEAKAIKLKAESDAEKAKTTGFDTGLAIFEQTPMIKKAGIFLSKTTRERDRLKKELEDVKSQLEEINTGYEELKAKYGELKAKAKNWYEGFKELFTLKKDHEKSITEIKELSIKASTLDNVSKENVVLKEKLSNAVSKIKHLELTVEALTPEPEPETVKKSARKYASIEFEL